MNSAPTPMLKQYFSVKENYKDAILLFRMGDFYEMFYDDAKIASKVLEITLTSRNKNMEEQVPLCGFPYHAAKTYIAKLIENGFKVAICDQVEDAKFAKGIVKREVTKVITPGTAVDLDNIDAKENNYLVSISQEGELFGFSCVDLSTGDFKFTEGKGKASLINEIARISPKEIITSHDFDLVTENKLKDIIGNFFLNIIDKKYFDYLQAKEAFLKQFQQDSNNDLKLGISSSGALIQYLAETQKASLKHISKAIFYQLCDYLVIDNSTIKNLEIFLSLQDSKKKGSLLHTIDETKTSMGGRKLKQWLSYPLIDAEKINERLDAVYELVNNPIILESLRNNLEKIQDLERISGKISLSHATPRDLLALKNSIKEIPNISKSLEMLKASFFKKYLPFPSLEEIETLIENSISEDAPLSLKEGGIIKYGYNKELDELKLISNEGKNWIANLEREEKLKTGINSLKIRYNQVFGYYIEITKPNLHLVPSNYIRKQTTANGERFITLELKEYEDKVLGAEEKIIELEYNLFCEIREKITKNLDKVQYIADILAKIDVISSFAYVALNYNYKKPIIDNTDIIDIKGGRHPIVERLNLTEGFVPNDVYLDSKENQILLITGPNMAGKSTFIRQVALIVLMAHIGSFVPADYAHIGVVDKIFTRVGASDNIAKGQSTFMVEMMETAHILNNATCKSLVILDEIGRGTSTYDGVSIAWAVAEYLHDNKDCRPKTLFATHYHELTELVNTKRRIKNFNVAVKEWEDQIIFLRKIMPGGTSRSYGIQVAQLAGLPQKVIDRAKEILKNLELDGTHLTSLDNYKNNEPLKKYNSPVQLSLFDTGGKYDKIIEKLKRIEVEKITPIEALNKLYELKDEVLGKKLKR